MTSPTNFVSHFGGIGRALSSRNYRVYWYGHSVSSHGVWIYQIASQWLMFHLTSSPAWLGAVGFAFLSPLLVLGPIAGAVSDRYGHRKIAIIAMVFGMTVSAATASITFVGQMTPVILVSLTAVQGIFMSFDFPSRQALIPQLLERKNLAAAISMNSTTFYTASFTGPMIGGFILALGDKLYGAPVGAALGYGVSTFGVGCLLLALLRVRIVNPMPGVKRDGPLLGALAADIKAGFDYVRASLNLKIIMILSVAAATFLRPFHSLMAGFAGDVFHLDAQGLGNLLAAAGIGALITAGLLAYRGTSRGLTRAFVFGAAAAAAALLVFVSSDFVPLALVSLAVAGGCLVATGIGAQTLIHNAVEDAFRARVISLNLTVVVGGPAFGTLGIGWLAEFVGLQIALGTAAVLVLIAVLAVGPKLITRAPQLEAEPPA